MAKCPKCQEELKSLTQVIDIREINTVWLEHGDLNVDNIDHIDIPHHDYELYSCPFCDEALFQDQKSAEEFLKGNNPDKPAKGRSGVGVF